MFLYHKKTDSASAKERQSFIKVGFCFTCIAYSLKLDLFTPVCLFYCSSPLYLHALGAQRKKNL